MLILLPFVGKWRVLFCVLRAKRRLVQREENESWERYKWAVECCLAGVGRALSKQADARLWQRLLLHAARLTAEQLFCERSCKGASQSLGGGAYGSGCRLCGSLGCFVQSWYVSLHGVES